jgi:hypothetical protein
VRALALNSAPKGQAILSLRACATTTGGCGWHCSPSVLKCPGAWSANILSSDTQAHVAEKDSYQHQAMACKGLGGTADRSTILMLKVSSATDRSWLQESHGALHLISIMWLDALVVGTGTCTFRTSSSMHCRAERRIPHQPWSRATERVQRHHTHARACVPSLWRHSQGSIRRGPAEHKGTIQYDDRSAHACKTDPFASL